jgi:hypothetical protein
MLAGEFAVVNFRTWMRLLVMGCGMQGSSSST